MNNNMNKISRRNFNAMLGAGIASLAVTSPARSQGKARVVVVGGGAGGATAARYVAKDSTDQVDITLIDDSDSYTSCFYSNLYLGGVRSFDYITHSYDLSLIHI